MAQLPPPCTRGTTSTRSSFPRNPWPVYVNDTYFGAESIQILPIYCRLLGSHASSIGILRICWHPHAHPESRHIQEPGPGHLTSLDKTAPKPSMASLPAGLPQKYPDVGPCSFEACGVWKSSSPHRRLCRHNNCDRPECIFLNSSMQQGTQRVDKTKRHSSDSVGRQGNTTSTQPKVI